MKQIVEAHAHSPSRRDVRTFLKRHLFSDFASTKITRLGHNKELTTQMTVN
jgi:hypothetical protein